ncbi:MAG: hypothetical protein MJ177_10110 [Clostridia bacterium]|nr:hypothetical protein [Clostridia bacterium]
MKYKKITIALLITVIAVTAIGAVFIIKSSDNGIASFFPTKKEDVQTQTQKFTAVPSRVSKSETVYAILDAAGGVKNITVSDRITTDIPNCAVRDKTNLTDIKQISSPIAFDTDKNGIVWHMGSTEFIYNGKCEKALPVSVSIKYYLNGEQMQPEEIYGKAGSVNIKIKLKNNEKRKISVAGLSSAVYSPFAVAGGMILTGGKYTDVSIDNGKVLSDASKDIIFMVGFPGLNESLNLNALGINDLSFPDEFNIKLTSSSFEASNFYFAVIPLSVLDASFALPESLSNALDGVSALSDIQSKLAAIDIDSLMKIFSSESGNNINDLVSSLSGAVNLFKSNSALLDVLEKYLTADNIAALKSFLTAVQQADLANNSALVNSAASLLGIGDLLTEFKNIEPLLSAMLSELNQPQVQTAIDNLPSTLAQIKSLQSVLDANGESLDAFVQFLESDSFNALLGLMSTYNENKSLFSAITASSQDLSQIVPYLEKWFSLAKDYTLYTVAPENAETEVMFIYRTQSPVIQ